MSTYVQQYVSVILSLFELLLFPLIFPFSFVRCSSVIAILLKWMISTTSLPEKEFYARNSVIYRPFEIVNIFVQYWLFTINELLDVTLRSETGTALRYQCCINVNYTWSIFVIDNDVHTRNEKSQRLIHWRTTAHRCCRCILKYTESNAVSMQYHEKKNKS
jgi:hypothetical protein